MSLRIPIAQALYPIQEDSELINNILGGRLTVFISTCFAIAKSYRKEDKEQSNRMIKHIINHLNGNAVKIGDIDCILDIILMLSKAKDTQEMEAFLSAVLDEIMAFLLNPSPMYKNNKVGSLQLHMLYHEIAKIPADFNFRLCGLVNYKYMDCNEYDRNPTENLYIFFHILYNIISTIEAIFLLMDNFCDTDKDVVDELRNRFISICKLNFPELSKIFRFTATDLEGNELFNISEDLYLYKVSNIEITDLIESFKFEFGRGPLLNKLLDIDKLYFNINMSGHENPICSIYFIIDGIIAYLNMVTDEKYYPYGSATFRLNTFLNDEELATLIDDKLPVAAFKTFCQILDSKYIV